MFRMDLYDSQGAFSFAVSQATNIEATVYQVKYPSFAFEELIPVVTEGNEWASSTTFFSMDFAGQAKWLSGAARDMPYADLDRSMFEHTFYMGGIGYQWNLEEINKARLVGINLGDDKATAARKIAQQMLWNISMTGKEDGSVSEKGWTGLLNNASVTAGDVAANGTGSVTWWAAKTPDQILADVNSGITGLFTGTGETEMADTILLPTSIYQDIATRPRTSTSDTTVLAFLLANNAYTVQTGRPLVVRGIRSLATADPGGDGRMVIYRRDPEVLRFHLPMPHKFLSVWQSGPLEFAVPGIFRTGGVEVRLPKAIRYLDGILDS